MKDLIEEELKTATFFVDLTAEDGVFYADPSNVQAVLERLQGPPHYITPDTLLGDHPSSQTSPRLPPKGFDSEQRSYKPFTQLLNIIISATNESLGPHRRYLGNLRFYDYGSEVAEVYGSFRSLKPDGVGLLTDLPASRRISWGDVQVVVEVKSDIKALVKQAATYARCSLLNDRRRFFSIVIGFNHRKLNVYFLVFHHSGLSSSRALSLNTRQGFEDVVKHLVGMLSITDEAGYHLDQTLSESQNQFYLNDRLYDVVRLVHMRDSLRGRSTAVYNLAGMDRRSFNVHNSTYVAAHAACTTNSDTPVADLVSRTLSLSRGTVVLPDDMTYKVSYPIEGYSQEGQLLSRFVGKFGIADVVGYHICGTDEPHGKTQPLFRSAERWAIFGGEGCGPEKRPQQCIAMSTSGRSLLDLKDEGGIPSPTELLETILHAIIGESYSISNFRHTFTLVGHCGLFLGGILHRDISSGNILRNVQPINRPALELCAVDLFVLVSLLMHPSVSNAPTQ